MSGLYILKRLLRSLLVLLAVIVVGFVCMRGFGSRSGY